MSQQRDVGVRLRRVEGQLAGVRRMYEDGRPCVECIDQLRAARAALESVALLIFEDDVRDKVQRMIEGDDDADVTSEILTAVHRGAGRP